MKILFMRFQSTFCHFIIILISHLKPHVWCIINHLSQSPLPLLENFCCSLIKRKKEKENKLILLQQCTHIQLSVMQFSYSSTVHSALLPLPKISRKNCFFFFFFLFFFFFFSFFFNSNEWITSYLNVFQNLYNLAILSLALYI